MEFVIEMEFCTKNAELYPCDRGSRKFKIGDRCRLVGLQDNPELDGEVVTITNYRESEGDLNAYYVRSESGNVEEVLNYVFERRLALAQEGQSKLDKYKITIAFVESMLSNDERVGVAMVSRLLTEMRELLAIVEGDGTLRGEIYK
jgi:hypothetical protein